MLFSVEDKYTIMQINTIKKYTNSHSSSWSLYR